MIRSLLIANRGELAFPATLNAPIPERATFGVFRM